MAQVIVEMKHYKLDISCVSERIWTRSRRIKSGTGDNCLLGRDNLHFEGVVIILKKGIEKYFMGWKSTNSTFEGQTDQYDHDTLLRTSNDNNSVEKEPFLSRFKRSPSVVSDLNSKVDSENEIWETWEKKGAKYRMAPKRSWQWCGFNNVITRGTIFLHRNILKLTWTSLSGQNQNQIDHLMVSSMWRRSLLDVKVRRGADVGSETEAKDSRAQEGDQFQMIPADCKIPGLRLSVLCSTTEEHFPSLKPHRLLQK